MKRGREDQEEEELVDAVAGAAKAPRLEETPVNDALLSSTWWFITSGEDGAAYGVQEWHPSRAKDPKKAVQLLLDARERTRALDKRYNPSMHMADVIRWLANPEHPDYETKPDGLPDDANAFFGSFTLIADFDDIGGMMHTGIACFYSSWC